MLLMGKCSASWSQAGCSSWFDDECNYDPEQEQQGRNNERYHHHRGGAPLKLRVGSAQEHMLVSPELGKFFRAYRFDRLLRSTEVCDRILLKER
jgi:hypothetical protein